MPVDETLINKSSEDVTGEDVRTLLNAPADEERPLIDPGVFDEKQPAQPIYKSIPLKFALAGVAALVVMVPTIKLFSGNLLSGNKPTKVASTEEGEKTETEEEKVQRLVEEENVDLKRKLALQNQSFTAQEIEDAAATESSAQTQGQAQRNPTQAISSRAPSPQQPVPVSRPVSAVAPRTPEPVRSAPFRPAPSARAIAPSKPAARAVVAAPPQPPVNLAEIAAAGNYGQLPSRPTPIPASGQTAQLVVSTADTPRFIPVADRNFQFSRSGSIPVSVRSQERPVATEAVSDESDAISRPTPLVMNDIPLTIPAEPKQLEANPKEEIALNEADTYEAQRDLIMRETEGLRSASKLPSLILPGSTADLEVTTAVTWAADLPRALGSVTLG